MKFVGSTPRRGAEGAGFSCQICLVLAGARGIVGPAGPGGVVWSLARPVGARIGPTRDRGSCGDEEHSDALRECAGRIPALPEDVRRAVRRRQSQILENGRSASEDVMLCLAFGVEWPRRRGWDNVASSRHIGIRMHGPPVVRCIFAFRPGDLHLSGLPWSCRS